MEENHEFTPLIESDNGEDSDSSSLNISLILRKCKPQKYKPRPRRRFPKKFFRLRDYEFKPSKFSISPSDRCNTDAHVTYHSFHELLVAIGPLLDTPNIRFTDFPPEIREMVYREYLKLDAQKTGWATWTTWGKLPWTSRGEKHVIEIAIYDDDYDTPIMEEVFPPLCWASKQMLHEVGTYMLRTSKLDLTFWHTSAEPILSYLDIFDNGVGFSAIRTLCLRGFTRGLHDHAPDIDPSPTQLLRLCPNVQYLTLTLTQWEFDPFLRQRTLYRSRSEKWESYIQTYGLDCVFAATHLKVMHLVLSDDGWLELDWERFEGLVKLQNWFNTNFANSGQTVQYHLSMEEREFETPLIPLAFECDAIGNISKIWRQPPAPGS